MKTRSISLTVLLAIIAAFIVGPSAASAAVPGIKTTHEYRALNNYVSFLNSKKNVATPVSRKTVYRSSLASKRLAANTKAKALYQRRIADIANNDDKKQRRTIKIIRRNQKSDVATVKDRQVAKINILQSKQTTAINRARAPFQAKINSFSNKRAILSARLKKTTNKTKRLKIQTKIDAIQAKINGLAADSQTAVNAVAARYNDKIAAVNALFVAKVAAVKARAAKLIARAKNAYKREYRDKIQTAKEIQTNDLALITSLRDRGAGYIDQMPLPQA